MQVKVMNRIYWMSRKEYQGLLQVASEQVPFGIFSLKILPVTLRLKVIRYMRTGDNSMDIPGFTLLLQDFCAYCPDFEPEIEKIEYSCVMRAPNCQNNIRCINRKRCARISANIQKRVNTDAKEE